MRNRRRTSGAIQRETKAGQPTSRKQKTPSQRKGMMQETKAAPLGLGFPANLQTGQNHPEKQNRIINNTRRFLLAINFYLWLPEA